MGNWYDLASFESQPETNCEEACCPFVDDSAFSQYRYERETARNTFLNRFECDPEAGPYDFDQAFQAFDHPFFQQGRRSALSEDRLAAPNYYEGRQLPFRSRTTVDNLPVVRTPDSLAAAEPLNMRVTFEVKDGVTTRAILDMPRDRLRSVKAGADSKFAGADILFSQGEPVEAVQGGLVVYSSRTPAPDDERINLNGLIVPVGDLSRYEGSVVIVQSWDPNVNGVRYHIYSGLDAASVVAGDRITAGQQIGRADSDGIRYEVHRQTVQGPAVRIEARPKGRAARR